MNRETHLWLIRHAPVDGPHGVIHAPDAPADLGDVAAFAALQAMLPVDAVAVCSPARRTSETAAKLGLAATEDDAFREQDFGDWTGRRHSEIEAELGAAAYRAFWQSPGTNRPPRGESFADQIARARAGLARLPAGDVVLVVHSGTIRAILAIALELAPELALRFVIDPLSLTRIDRLENAWRVVAVNLPPLPTPSS
ncbi:MULTISPECIES: histidine phosphatase family protein [unclassified Bradyrhizobium]|uniref:histidine phosphatase family protein n=1 Tax=unclassified Bradyrhizobium TaxID=2631580 RepID=UPI001BA809B4|nr:MULTISPECIES: histidine phosphatase family protein [unclassified Bradyrhizobium]MBR1203431.1 histidine phosphatase family protein [Bradyrhizobium sp. AUGA SZCCT0124]MBR1313094.1 histidine phosphatase family protein [Bradyrhizobium sp. AUGA SZCCT0051]MBR1341452.1 histidine phosphatase family protein [Bradyrhizobium sp. AUGA SZCCT0105]MBR1356610.1 histidine phosphatase family protein [Bradyrhizobium sp. AUGA SZCCT0045]